LKPHLAHGNNPRAHPAKAGVDEPQNPKTPKRVKFIYL
jgi:hypothetical protein